MEAEVIQQIGEIAKNVSIAFDGKLNSETLVEIAKEVTPQVMRYLYFLQIKGFLVQLLWAIAVVISAYLVSRTLLRLSVKEE